MGFGYIAYSRVDPPLPKPPLVPVASVGCANTAAFSVELPKQWPDAARNATNATFAWGPFRVLKSLFQGSTA